MKLLRVSEVLIKVSINFVYSFKELIPLINSKFKRFDKKPIHCNLSLSTGITGKVAVQNSTILERCI